jgi:hypothetical protein
MGCINRRVCLCMGGWDFSRFFCVGTVIILGVGRGQWSGIDGFEGFLCSFSNWL